jgi:hypothetical protein
MPSSVRSVRAAVLTLTGLCAIAAAPAAEAACSDRPGTPIRLTTRVNSDSSITLGWTNTRRLTFNLGQRTCWDIEVRDGRGAAVGKDITGGSCVHVTDRALAGHRFDGLDENKRYCFRVRARTEPGTQGCVSQIWAGPVCATTQADKKDAACRNYANRAIGAAKMARDTYKCDPKVISGPRWSTNFEEHLRWCRGAEPKTANFEDKERIRIMHACRVDAGKGPAGKPALSVTSKGGDTFFLNVSGFPPNVPVIIRLAGAGASISSVTTANNQRIIANAQGAVSIRLFGAQICKRGGGTVIFTAEDQDGRKSPPATSKCSP